MKSILVGLMSSLIVQTAFAQAYPKCSEYDIPKTDYEKLICGQQLAQQCGFNYVYAQEADQNYSGMQTFLRYFINTKYIAGTYLGPGYFGPACYRALKMLASIDSAPQRPKELNNLIFYVGLTNLGSVLHYGADKNKDGMIDLAFDSCDPTKLQSWSARQLGETIWEMHQAAKYSDIDNLKSFEAYFSQVSAALNYLNIDMDFLSPNIDPANFTAAQERGVRSLLNEGQYFGVGNCTWCSIEASICP